MNYFNTFFNSFSQVFLIESRFLGMAIFLGLVLAKPRLGIFSALGLLIALFFSIITGVEKSIIQTGIIGFNSVLIGITCAYFLPKNSIALLTLVAAVILGVLIQLISIKYNIPIFTLPFVLLSIAIYFFKPILFK